MNRFKWGIAGIIIALGVLISACGNGSAKAVSTDVPIVPADKKVLVVYYSDTGNTKAVADKIAKETGADEFRLELTQPYTEEDLNYNDEDSRVSREHENPSLRHGEYTKDVANWKDYDMVFIGYPIWWQQAAWTVEPFVKGHDFSGKIVIPFATSAMSDIGDSGENLALLAGRKGKWLDGRRFSGDASTDEVHEWLQSLDLSK